MMVAIDSCVATPPFRFCSPFFLSFVLCPCLYCKHRASVLFKGETGEKGPAGEDGPPGANVG